MQNFTLTFGKHKGQKIFDTPIQYYQWLLEQKFTAPKECYQILEEGNKVVVNYRYYRFPNKKPFFISYEGTLLSVKDKYIMISIPQSIEYIDESNNKNCINYKPLKVKILKSTIASIENL